MSKQLPQRPNLELLKKQAKALFRDFKNSDPEAIARFRPITTRQPGEKLKLADAQHMIATEYGFETWATLKRRVHMDQLDFSKRVDKLLSAVCEDNLSVAEELLGWDDNLAMANIFTAAATGEYECVQDVIAGNPALVNEKGGPDNLEPILYVCFSRFLRPTHPRSAGVVHVGRILLEHKANPNAFFGERQTAIYGAAGVSNNAEMTRLLLEHGADPNDGDAEGFGESLYHAAEFPDNECLRLLLEAGPEKRKVSYCIKRKLDFEDYDGAKLFLEHGCDPDFLTPFGDGGSSLHHAIRRNRGGAIIQLLVDYGGDYKVINRFGQTAFALSVRLGHLEAERVFRNVGATDDDLTPTDKFLGDCANAGTNADKEEVARHLKENPDLIKSLTRDEMTILVDAAAEGKTEAVRTMLECGFDPGVSIDGKMTALHMAVWRGEPDIVDILLRYNAPLEAKNMYGGTVLSTAIYAVIFGGVKGDHINVIRRLLNAGASIDIEWNEGPLWRTKTGNSEIDELIEEQIQQRKPK